MSFPLWQISIIAFWHWFLFCSTQCSYQPKTMHMVCLNQQRRTLRGSFILNHVPDSCSPLLVFNPVHFQLNIICVADFLHLALPVLLKGLVLEKRIGLETEGWWRGSTGTDRHQIWWWQFLCVCVCVSLHIAAAVTRSLFIRPSSFRSLLGRLTKTNDSASEMSRSPPHKQIEKRRDSPSHAIETRSFVFCLAVFSPVTLENWSWNVYDLNTWIMFHWTKINK